MNTHENISTIYNFSVIIIYFFINIFINFIFFGLVFYSSLIYSTIFCILLYLILKQLDGFEILNYRIRDICFSLFITLLINNIIFILFYLTFLNIDYFIMVILFKLLVELFIYFLLVILFNNIYYGNVFNKTLLLYEKLSDIEVQKIQNKFKKYKYRYNIVLKQDFIDFNLSDIKNYDTIIISLSYDNKIKILNEAFRNKKKVISIPENSDILNYKNNLLTLIDFPVYEHDFSGINKIDFILKRYFDIIVSLPLFILFFPIMIITSIFIKIEDGGPIIYSQKRLTKGYKEFNIYKFRSMIVDAEKNGAQLAKKHDSRITKTGRFIRKFRIDELPQLVNILKGDMSIIGPRPERPEIFSDIIKKTPDFEKRLQVKAGITGLAQVEGKYNTEFKDKLKYDLVYINNYSIFLDIKILINTIKIVFSKESTEGLLDE